MTITALPTCISIPWYDTFICGSRTQVNQRVSLSERAAEAVRQRVEGIAEEVANLGETIRKSNASTATALEQLLAGEQRSRCVRRVYGTTAVFKSTTHSRWITQLVRKHSRSILFSPVPFTALPSPTGVRLRDPGSSAPRCVGYVSGAEELIEQRHTRTFYTRQ